MFCFACIPFDHDDGVAMMMIMMELATHKRKFDKDQQTRITHLFIYLFKSNRIDTTLCGAVAEKCQCLFSSFFSRKEANQFYMSVQ